MEQVLGPIGRLEPKHELLLLVVGGDGCVGMVYSYSVGYIIERVVFEYFIVFVQINDHVAQRRVKHLPAALEERRFLAV